MDATLEFLIPETIKDLETIIKKVRAICDDDYPDIPIEFEDKVLIVRIEED